MAKPTEDDARDTEESTVGDDVALSEAVEARIEDEVEARVEQIVMERYSSQFPHPEHLERYAKLFPDAPRMVFENFDKQSEHRRVIEKIFVRGNERRATIGQWLAFSLVLVTVGVGLVAILIGEATPGSIIIGAAFAGGVVLYIAGGGSRTQPAVRTQGPNQRDSASATSGRARRTTANS